MQALPPIASESLGKSVLIRAVYTAAKADEEDLSDDLIAFQKGYGFSQGDGDGPFEWKSIRTGAYRWKGDSFRTDFNSRP
jgi:hypothetical protein